MKKKLFSGLLSFFAFCSLAEAQPVNISTVSTTGRFSICNASLGLPVVTATLLPGTGSSVVNGVITPYNSQDSSELQISLSNIRWSQGNDNVWIHGFFITSAPEAKFSGTVLTPASWQYMTTGCTGAPCSTGLTGGAGYYYAGPGASCCPGGETTPNPCDNFGDFSYNCNASMSLTFRIKIKNSAFSSNNYSITFRGTNDGSTGCWSIGDVYFNTITFSFASSPAPAEYIICNPSDNAVFTTSSPGPYQWQMSTDSVNYTNLSDNGNYTGTNSNTLSVANIPSSSYGNRYRVIANNIILPFYTVKVSNTWTGNAGDNNWNNPANWSCGAVPDINTDAVINSGTIVISVNGSVRSLTLQPGVVFTVNPGVTFTILH